MKTVRLAIAFTLVLASAASPALAGGKDLDSTPQAKAYRACMKAIDAADYAAYKGCMVSTASKDFDAQMKEMKKTPKDVMEFFKIMQPKEIKFTDLKVDGKKATLYATGKQDAEVNKGTIELAEENGQWKVGKQSWTNAK